MSAWIKGRHRALATTITAASGSVNGWQKEFQSNLMIPRKIGRESRAFIQRRVELFEGQRGMQTTSLLHVEEGDLATPLFGGHDVEILCPRESSHTPRAKVVVFF